MNNDSLDSTFRETDCRNKRVIEWIDVKDKLPNKYFEDYLITDGKKITIGHLGRNLKTWFDYFDCIYPYHIKGEEVTHWADISHLKP